MSVPNHVAIIFSVSRSGIRETSTQGEHRLRAEVMR